MAQLTITEALAEIKTTKARIAKKRQSIVQYIVRNTQMKDPLESAGGSAEFIKKERQSIGDLEERIVAIRCAIQAANLQNKVDVNGESRSVAAWLNWRREISGEQRSAVNSLVQSLNSVRKEILQKGLTVTQNPQGALGEVLINIDEATLAGEAEQIEKTLGDLDGRLSLFNATTSIED